MLRRVKNKNDAVKDKPDTTQQQPPRETEVITNTGGGGGVSIINGIGGQKIVPINASGIARTAGELRIQSDIEQLDVGTVAWPEFDDPDDLTHFRIMIRPQQGMWCGALYAFNFVITRDYPHVAPKVTCGTKIFHPNIEPTGKVCLPVISDMEWKPIMDLNQIIYSLCNLFNSPDPDDPLHPSAGALLRANPTQFAETVKRTLQGYSHEGIQYPKLL
jgi:ubiquitin-conjugating enzyme E2 M